MPSVPVSYANGKLFEPGGGSRSHDRDRRGNHACFQDETKRDISRKQAEARKAVNEIPSGHAAMKTSRFLAPALIAVMALAMLPASTAVDNRTTCGIALTSDAHFKQLERIRSAGAAKICAMYLNTIDAQLIR
ncbi:MAG: hypothetical protein ACJ8EA_21280 [Xanthobacteraceae bacterium]